ncbi:hypothetical protein [Sphingomonas hengshuiensis]|uniref:hypothetical protein n=1 Tax=Sphingomonas hengshuiensis TaxID=1609977 RepID=UPI0006986C5D|nr:hypothetical protein [Sphingomonas hengshuiensis]
MDLRTFGSASANQTAAYTVTVALVVEDAGLLWAAAAERAMAAPGATLADVLDTIGPREDPAIAECIAMLTAPRAIPGCGMDSFTVREANTPSASPRIQLPSQADPRRMEMLPVAFG